MHYTESATALFIFFEQLLWNKLYLYMAKITEWWAPSHGAYGPGSRTTAFYPHSEGIWFLRNLAIFYFYINYKTKWDTACVLKKTSKAYNSMPSVFYNVFAFWLWKKWTLHLLWIYKQLCRTTESFLPETYFFSGLYSFFMSVNENNNRLKLPPVYDPILLLQKYVCWCVRNKANFFKHVFFRKKDTNSAAWKLFV